MKKMLFLCCLWILTGLVSAQTKLNEYISEGLKSNEVLNQRKISLERSLWALKEAKNLYAPSVTFGANYYRADGGRTVDFPIGDLLNPVYQTLNQLTGSDKFPQLENQSILLNPNDFYDARFRVSMPLINAEIQHNKRIKQYQYDLQKTEISIYQRELVKDVKKAYFQYLQATKAIEIYENAQKIVTESNRVNKSLFNNQKVNRTVVTRSDNELTKIESQIKVAQENQKNTQAYFNFLLNKPLDSPIQIEEYSTLPVLKESDTEVNKREELSKLATATQVNNEVTALSKAYLVPKVNVFADLGSQGFQWKFNDKTRYYFAGISLEWNLFASGRNIQKIKQNELDGKILSSQINQTNNQLQLQAQTSINTFKSSLAVYESNMAQQKTAIQYYNDMLKLYKEGQALYIELLDAQNQYISTQLQTNIALFDTWMKYAEVERANASFNIE
ncbi:MAG: TolC family protein [Raineya sp.]|jgi:outer membrane protein TolC|nr:TolC family protein [Raineya sp.]